MAFGKSKIGLNVIAAIVLYATVLIYQGYQYGQSDQSQILPVLYAQDHPGIFAKDHYVTNYLQSPVNERSVFHFILRFTGYASPFIVWCWHALSSLALILGLMRIASMYLKNTVFQWISIVFILIAGFHTSAGGNELYYNQLVPSLPAKAMCAWAIYYWLKEKYWSWSVLLIIACLVQPLVGLQVFMVSTAGMVMQNIFSKNKIQFPAKQAALYVLLALPWIALLAINNGGHQNSGLFFEIIKLRLPHHFFASTWGAIHLLLAFIFSVIAIVSFKGKMRWMLVSIFTGYILYETGVEIFHSTLVLNTQWWKTSIWSEAFAVIGGLSFVETSLRNRYSSERFALVSIIGVLILVSAYRFSGIHGNPPEYMLPFAQSLSPETEISQKAKALTDESTVFIIPPDLTAFRWYSQRNTYVDWKAMLHNETFIFDWYKRIKEVYGYTPEIAANGISIGEQAKAAFRELSFEKLEALKKAGVTHIIGFIDSTINAEEIGRNDKYVIYRLL